MTSSMVRPRMSFAWVSPSTHLKASTMLLLPDPLGPTMATMPPSNRISVRRAKVLKPLRVMARKCTAWAAGYQMWWFAAPRSPSGGACLAGSRDRLADGQGHRFGLDPDPPQQTTRSITVADEVEAGRAGTGLAAARHGRAVVTENAEVADKRLEAPRV